jgi:hypothetical protein
MKKWENKMNKKFQISTNGEKLHEQILNILAHQGKEN